MTTARHHDDSTPQRLLSAAAEVFAAKGYRAGTIAEICRRAGANIAAVNYYFRNKQTLYVQAWRRSFERSLEAHPPDAGIPADAPVEQRLRGRILALMQRVADPATHEFEIVQKEVASPTGLLAEVMRESIQPIRQAFGELMREMLGADAPEEQVLLCQRSIHAQCFHPLMRQRHRRAFGRGGQDDGLRGLDVSVEAMADHVFRFSLAGIRDIRRQIQRDRPRDVEQHA